jgi:hypothetical protein
METADQNIRDTNAIFKIIESSFFNVPVYMLFQSKSYPVKPVAITPDGLFIKSIGRQDHNSRLLVVTNGGNLFKFIFDFKGGNQNYEILYPLELTIQKAHRSTDRLNLTGNQIITNIVNQAEIPKSINFDQPKINQLIQNYKDKVKEKIDYMEILISERVDGKMRLLNDFDKPIFIPNKLEPDQVPEDCIPFKDYLSLMKNNKNLKQFTSETTIPLKYKNLVSFGYISAYNTQAMEYSIYKLTEAIAQSFKSDLLHSNLIGESKEKAPIIDISEGGLSFLYPNGKHFSKLFSVGSVIVFDLQTADKNYHTLRGVVRNIKTTESSFRVGCEFYRQNSSETDLVKKIVETFSTNSDIKK